MTDLVHGAEAERWGGWSWREPSRGEHFRRCSYCGSIHPDDLVAEPVWRAQWADRKYGWPHKFYVDMPNRNPDEMFVVTACTRLRDGEQPPAGAVRTKDLNRKQRKIAKRDGWNVDNYRDGYVGFSTRASHFGKFYTLHLADPAISDETKDRIAVVSGLRLHFKEDGRVSWHAPTGCDHQ